MLIVVKVLTWLCSPTGIFITGNLLGMAFLMRWVRLARSVIFISSLQLVFFSVPTIADILTKDLETEARSLEKLNRRSSSTNDHESYSAIVLLGGGISPAAPPTREYPDLGEASDRAWHAARLYRAGLAQRIIISGGRGLGLEQSITLQTEAQATRLLLLDFGIPDSSLILEEQARTTRENAHYVKSMVGDKYIALVTSASHMPRAFRTFENQNIRTHAYPTDFQIATDAQPLWEKFLPTARDLKRSEIAIKEHLALMLGY